MPALLLSLVASAVSAQVAPADRLAVIDRMPEFALTDQRDRPFDSKNLRGKVVLVNFVFTTCTGSCPATTLKTTLIAGELERRGLFKGDRVALVSITLDPSRDDPATLTRYMKIQRAEPTHWSFLTGSDLDVGKVIAAWGMWVKPNAEGKLDHPSRAFLVDTRGRIREIYSLEFLNAKWVAEDVAALLDK